MFSDVISDDVVSDDGGKAVSFILWIMVHVYIQVYVRSMCDIGAQFGLTAAGVIDALAKEMFASTLQLNTISCFTTISACGSCDDWWAAWGLLAKVPATTMQHFIVTRNAVLIAVEMAATGRWRWASWLRCLRTPCS